MTSVKIVNVEYYMSYPVRDLDVSYSEYRGVEVRQVPVLQIFGSTRQGTKTCLHIHGVLPYIYIPYDGVEPADRMAYKLAAEIDKSLNISLGQANANSCFVHNIVLVSGTPLYGYHENEHQFFKIFFYNPMIVKKACSLLENGAILGKCFQPHESHINYVLQFMIDYNLQGMNYIQLSHIKYRIDPDNPELLADIAKDQILPHSVQKRSFCKLEVDATASDITNIEEISSGKLAVNPGLAALWEDEKQRRRNKDLDSQLSFCLTQDRPVQPKSTATHRLFKQKFYEKLANPSCSVDTSIDLDKSVYPAERPSNVELLNASVVLSNALTTPSNALTTPSNALTTPSNSGTTNVGAGENTREKSPLDSMDFNMFQLLQDLKESAADGNESLLDASVLDNNYSQRENDVKLLHILQELKENANCEDDSILSQTVQVADADHSSSEDDELHNLSLPLTGATDIVESNASTDEDLIAANSLRDKNCEIPQLDGLYDSSNSSSDDLDSSLSYNWQNVVIPTECVSTVPIDVDDSSTHSERGACGKTMLERYFTTITRDAHDVYLAQNEQGTLPTSQMLTRGLNFLKVSCAPRESGTKVNILSKIVNPEYNLSILVFADDLTQFSINILRKTEMESIEPVRFNETDGCFGNDASSDEPTQENVEVVVPFPSNDDAYLDESNLNDVMYNDVNFGCDITTPRQKPHAISIASSSPKMDATLSSSTDVNELSWLSDTGEEIETIDTSQKRKKPRKLQKNRRCAKKLVDTNTTAATDKYNLRSKQRKKHVRTCFCCRTNPGARFTKNTKGSHSSESHELSNGNNNNGIYESGAPSRVDSVKYPPELDKGTTHSDREVSFDVESCLPYENIFDNSWTVLGQDTLLPVEEDVSTNKYNTEYQGQDCYSMLDDDNVLSSGATKTSVIEISDSSLQYMDISAYCFRDSDATTANDVNLSECKTRNESEVGVMPELNRSLVNCQSENIDRLCSLVPSPREHVLQEQLVHVENERKLNADKGFVSSEIEESTSRIPGAETKGPLKYVTQLEEHVSAIIRKYFKETQIDTDHSLEAMKNPTYSSVKTLNQKGLDETTGNKRNFGEEVDANKVKVNKKANKLGGTSNVTVKTENELLGEALETFKNEEEFQFEEPTEKVKTKDESTFTEEKLVNYKKSLYKDRKSSRPNRKTKLLQLRKAVRTSRQLNQYYRIKLAQIFQEKRKIVNRNMILKNAVAKINVTDALNDIGSNPSRDDCEIRAAWLNKSQNSTRNASEDTNESCTEPEKFTSEGNVRICFEDNNNVTLDDNSQDSSLLPGKQRKSVLYSTNGNNRKYTLISNRCSCSSRVNNLDAQMNVLSAKSIKSNKDYVPTRQGDFRGCFRTGIPERDQLNQSPDTTSSSFKRAPLSRRFHRSLHSSTLGYGGWKCQLHKRTNRHCDKASVARKYQSSASADNVSVEQVSQSVSVGNVADDHEVNTSSDNQTLNHLVNANALMKPSVFIEKTDNLYCEYDIPRGEVKAISKHTRNTPCRSVKVASKAEELELNKSMCKTTDDKLNVNTESYRAKPDCQEVGQFVKVSPTVNQKPSPIKTTDDKLNVNTESCRAKPDCQEVGQFVKVSPTVNQKPSPISKKMKCTRRRRADSDISWIASTLLRNSAPDLTYKRKLRSFDNNTSRFNQSTEMTSVLNNIPFVICDSSSEDGRITKSSVENSDRQVTEDKNHVKKNRKTKKGIDFTARYKGRPLKMNFRSAQKGICNDWEVKDTTITPGKKGTKGRNMGSDIKVLSAFNADTSNMKLNFEIAAKETDNGNNKHIVKATKRKYKRWNLDGQGDTSGSSESSLIDTVVRPRITKRSAKERLSARDNAKVKAKVVQSSKQPSRMITRKRTKELSTKALEDKHKKSRTFKVLTKQLKSGLVPHKSSAKTNVDVSKNKKHLAATSKSTSDKTPINSSKQNSCGSSNKQTSAATAAMKLKNSKSPLAQADLTKQLDSGRITGRSLTHKIVKDDEDQRADIRAPVSKKKEKTLLKKMLVVSLIRENLADKQRSLVVVCADAKTTKSNKTIDARGVEETPPRASGSGSTRTTPKYRPLNVTMRSPKCQRSSNIQNVNPALQLQQDRPNTLSMSKKPRAKKHGVVDEVNEIRVPVVDISESGIGELQVNGIMPIIQSTTASEKTKTLLMETKPICDNASQAIPSEPMNLSSISKPTYQQVQCDENSSKVKKQLFTSKDIMLNVTTLPDTTLVEEKKVCSYEKSRRKSTKPQRRTSEQNFTQISRVIEQEESFLNEIDKIYEQHEFHSDFSKTDEHFDLHVEKSPVKFGQENMKDDLNLKQCDLTSKPNELTLKQRDLVLKQSEINSNVSDRIVLSDRPVRKTNLNSSFLQRDFTTPEKKICPSVMQAMSGETLSQKCQKELFDTSNHYTKISDLSVAEIYDLKRGFAPQPSTSKTTDNCVFKSQLNCASSKPAVANISAYKRKTGPFKCSATSQSAIADSNVKNIANSSMWGDCGAKIGAIWRALDTAGSCNPSAAVQPPHGDDFNRGSAELDAMGVYNPFVYDCDNEMNDYDNLVAEISSTTDDNNDKVVSNNAAILEVSLVTDDIKENESDRKGNAVDCTEELNNDKSLTSGNVGCGGFRSDESLRFDDNKAIVDFDNGQMKKSNIAALTNDNSVSVNPSTYGKMQLETSLAVFNNKLFDNNNLIEDTVDVQESDTVIESTPPENHTSNLRSQRKKLPVTEAKFDMFANDDLRYDSANDSTVTYISLATITKTAPQQLIHNSRKNESHQSSSDLLTDTVTYITSTNSQLETAESANNIPHNQPQLSNSQIEKSAIDSSTIDTSVQEDTFINTKSPPVQLLTQNLSILEPSLIQQDPGLPKSNIFMPKYYPPTYQDIENSLAEYNIPECRYQQPFYSDYADVTRKVDVGHNVLKIPSNTVMDLEEFRASSGFIRLDAWRRERYKEFYPSQDIGKLNFHIALATDSEVIITPGIEPPTPSAVVQWLEAKEQAANIKLSPKKVPKPKILVPLNPSGNLDDSMSETMTLTPYSPDTPILVPSQFMVEDPETTPKHSQTSASFIRQRKNKENLQRKVLFAELNIKPTVTESEVLCSKLSSHLSDASTHNNSHQITGVSLDNTHDFKVDYENLQHAKAVSEPQNLTTLVVELHICTRGELFPDPQYDSVRAIFYSILNDVPTCAAELPREETGVLVVDTLPDSADQLTTPLLDGSGIDCAIVYTRSETELMAEFVKLIRKWDPDIFAGYEIEMHSWGYLIDRCNVIGINLAAQIARINPAVVKSKVHENAEQSKDIQLVGRIVLDIWRLIRHEIALQSYTFENIMYHILHRRVPKYSYKSLSFWWDYKTNFYRHITARYYILRTEGVLKLLDQLDLIGRTSELAKLFGIQFYEVLSRGSQFRVESMMLRLAKPLNYIPVSPNVSQRAKMCAPEFVPLIFEPESRFYTDPVIVLDFQSLYPSIIIAYNYCFSTCIGRVKKLGSDQPFEFGAASLKVPRATLRKLQHNVNFSPCGVGFVKAAVRQGILPRMLQEILETRLMVKNSMKENKANKLLQRVLHSRQLGLKLIANVTYGYTAANFSGRMPCIEVGDSVVSKGRETLERAIKLIQQTPRWRARVVYGDTDSLFVLVPGRSKDEAFRIGAEIADAVTNDNPTPVKLKLEKILLPCILQTKKRYVGYMYESAEQEEPEYLAKGIETVRRDGCPAVAKMLEKSLRILFETRDVTLVKRYVCRQFAKLLSGRASVQDLTFAREYRGADGYRPGACVPALELTRRWRVTDKRHVPRRSERVPYVIVHGPPSLPLIKLVRCPRELLADPSRLRPNAEYYITRVIAPPLNRCFALIGADVQAWYNDMPRKQLQILPIDVDADKHKKSTISQYFATMSCAGCGARTRDGLCETCYSQPQTTLVVLYDKLNQWERTYDEVSQICQSCCGRSEYVDCMSLDCPVMYRLNQVRRDLKQVPFVRKLIARFDNN